MATEVTEDVQRAEKVDLKRKLTGPPKLLLGKTRTRSVGEDRPEAKTDKLDEVDEPAAAAESEITDLTGSPNMQEEVLSVVKTESGRRRRKVTGEDGDARNGKMNRRRWWRRFSSAVVCTRKQEKKVEGSLEKQETTSVNHNERRSNMTLRRFQTSFDRKTQEPSREPSLTLQKKLRGLFTRAVGRRLSAEDEAPCSSGANGDERTEPHREEAQCRPDQVHDCVELQRAATDLSSEAEMIPALEDRAVAASLEQVRGDIDNMDENVTDAADGSGTTSRPPVGRPVGGVSSDRDVVLDDDEHRSASPEVHTEETGRPLQLFTNGPSIRIELVPPDDLSLQDEEEEEECWEGRSSENQNHLLLLLSFDHSEQQLLHVARSLVRAAMNAAVDQLSREQQGGSEHVHRQPQDFKDHA